MTAENVPPLPPDSGAEPGPNLGTLRILLGLAYARGRHIPDAIRTFEQLAQRQHIPEEWLALVDRVAAVIDDRTRFSLSPDQRRDLLGTTAHTATAAHSPAAPLDKGGTTTGHEFDFEPVAEASAAPAKSRWKGATVRRMFPLAGMSGELEIYTNSRSDDTLDVAASAPRTGGQGGPNMPIDDDFGPVPVVERTESGRFRQVQIEGDESSVPLGSPLANGLADGAAGDLASGVVAPFTPYEMHVDALFARDDGRLVAGHAPPASPHPDEVGEDRRRPIPDAIRVPLAGPFRVLGRYEGAGADGLFACRDEPTGQKVTIRIPRPKLFRPENREAVLHRLSRMAGAELPGVLVKIFGAADFIEEPAAHHPYPSRLHAAVGGHFGLVEEARGTWITFDYWLDQAPSVMARTEIALALANGLSHLARMGVPHGRFTPDVIRITPAGEPKIGDWAWAAAVPVDHAGGENSAAERLPAPLWFYAPEVYLSVKNVTPQADQYSLGVLLFRLFTGHLPPEWEQPRTLMQSIHAIERGLITKPSSLNDALPDTFDQVLLRATATDPARRYADFADFRADLEAALEQIINPDVGPITGIYRVAAIESEGSADDVHAGSSRYPLGAVQHPPPIKFPAQYDRLADVKMRGTTNIFFVRHRETRGHFALKLFCIPPINGEMIRRQAEHEYQALLRCQGDYIATLQDYGRFGIDDQYHYIAMEWADGWPVAPDTASGTTDPASAASESGRQSRANTAGEMGDDGAIRSLRDLQAPIPEFVAVWIATHALRALHHCHNLGVVHYDVKPANFLCFGDGMCKLTDFGVANYQRAYAPIQKGQIFGSPAYISPEQVAGSKTPDPRSDLFSLGVMLHELVTGRRPNPYLPPNEAGYCLPNFLPPQDPTPDSPWGLSPGFAGLIGELLQPDLRQRIRTAAEAFDRLKESPVHPVGWNQVKPYLKRARRPARK